MRPKVTVDCVSGHEMHSYSMTTEAYLNRGNSTSARIPSLSVSGTGPPTHGTSDASAHGPASPIRRRTSNQESKLNTNDGRFRTYV